MHTVKMFWTGKRFLKLFIFALLMGNVTLYCVGMLAKRQVIQNAVSHHNKVYTAYLQAIERARKATTVQPATTAPSVSPYWVALREVRRQFPYFKMNVVLQGSTETERDRKVLEMLKNRPRGWTVTNEYDGWARSFYALPTKNAAAFQTVSYVRDELNAWESTAMMIGGYAFILLFAFGWFWTRALDDVEVAPTSDRDSRVRAQLLAMREIMVQMDAEFESMRATIEIAARNSNGPNSEVMRALDEMAAQMRLLAINGSVEAARSPDTYRVFHVIMQEINQLATHSRELLRTLGSQGDHSHLEMIRRKIQDFQNLLQGNITSGGQADDQQPRSPGGSSSRRVG